MVEASLSNISEELSHPDVLKTPSEQRNHITDESVPSDEEDEFPKVRPCFYGKELEIPDELVNVGLSAISKKHHEEVSEDINSESETCYTEIFKHRNSFWDIHRPELTKLNWAEYMSQHKLLSFFHQHAESHGPYCQSLHGNTVEKEPDEVSHLLVMHEPEYESEYEEEKQDLEPDYCVQITDEDIQPENQLRKSHGQFCVTIGILSSSFETRDSELATIGEHSSTICSEDVQSAIDTNNEGDTKGMFLQS